jgi:hypothetical protein
MPTDMAEVPETRLCWAREDTQLVSIMLPSPNLIGPFPGGPGPFWNAASHPAGWTRGSERRPTAKAVKKLLFSGSVARDDRRRVTRQCLLNKMVIERHDRLRNRTERHKQLSSSSSCELALFFLKMVLLKLSACCIGLNAYTA